MLKVFGKCFETEFVFFVFCKCIINPIRKDSQKGPRHLLTIIPCGMYKIDCGVLNARLMTSARAKGIDYIVMNKKGV